MISGVTRDKRPVAMEAAELYSQVRVIVDATTDGGLPPSSLPPNGVFVLYAGTHKTRTELSQ